MPEAVVDATGQSAEAEFMLGAFQVLGGRNAVLAGGAGLAGYRMFGRLIDVLFKLVDVLADLVKNGIKVQVDFGKIGVSESVVEAAEALSKGAAGPEAPKAEALHDSLDDETPQIWVSR